jgi:hypothetical protein
MVGSSALLGSGNSSSSSSGSSNTTNTKTSSSSSSSSSSGSSKYRNKDSSEQSKHRLIPWNYVVDQFVELTEDVATSMASASPSIGSLQRKKSFSMMHPGYQKRSQEVPIPKFHLVAELKKEVEVEEDKDEDEDEDLLLMLNDSVYEKRHEEHLAEMHREYEIVKKEQDKIKRDRVLARQQISKRGRSSPRKTPSPRYSRSTKSRSNIKSRYIKSSFYRSSSSKSSNIGWFE